MPANDGGYDGDLDVELCTGKHCSKRPEAPQLARFLAEVSAPIEIRCLGICDGPVIAVGSGHAAIVLRHIRKPKDRRAVARLIDEGHITERLKKRTVTGTERRKAVDRLERFEKRSARAPRTS